MRTYLRISSGALLHNLRLFRQHTKKNLLLTVKANAYGHGLKEVAQIADRFEGLGYFGVDSLDEAEALFKIGVSKPILLLGWTPREEMAEVIRRGVETVLPSVERYREIFEIARNSGIQARVHLKIETGTNRLGIKPNQALKLLEEWDFQWVKLVGVYSHFANIEDTSDYSFARKQLKTFDSFLKKSGLSGLTRHFSCSASALLFPETYFDLVRLGISAYGYWPSKQTLVSFRQKFGNGLKLNPVLSWHSYVAQVKELKPGEAVGYGLSYKTYRRTRIAVIPAGYYDGYPRALSNLASVLINGEYAPIRGRICMNMLMAEVSHIRNCQSGDEVTLIGEQGGKIVDAEQLAQLAQTISYEILARINPLLPRVIGE